QNPYQNTLHGHDDAFVTKLNSIGNGLVYSTYLGGSGIDEAHAIALDSADDAYVTGNTLSKDFPSTPAAFQPSMALSAFGNAFVTKLNATGTVLTYSTFLGGNNSAGSTGPDQGLGIAVDASGEAYVAGATNSPNFPVTAGAFQTAYSNGSSVMNPAFMTKLNASGSALVYSTFLEGSATDTPAKLAIDTAGNAYVTGNTSSANFPTVNPLQASMGDPYGT